MKYLKFALLFATIGIQAQQVDLTWAEKIKTRKNVVVLGGLKGNYYTGHADTDNHLVCRKYNSNMEMVSEKAVPFELDEKRYSLRQSLFIDNKIVHIIEERKRKEDKYQLLAAFTDLDLNTNDKTLIIDEITEKELTSTFGDTYISPDSTKVLVFHEKSGKKKEPSRLSLKVYSSDFKSMLLDKIVEIPIRDRDFSTKSISVDNLGNVYVLANVFRGKKERVKGQSATYYKLIAFEKGSGAPKEFDFDFLDQDISSIDIIPSKNNTLICTGFVSDVEAKFLSKRVSNVSDEMFSTVIDCNNLDIVSKFKVQVPGLYPQKVRKSQDFVPYKVRDIFPKEDGGYIAVAEQYKLVIITTTTPNGGTTTRYKYYYCDIACMSVDKAGNLESITKVPKYQMNAENPSIMSTYVNGNTYIVYEDLTKNVDAYEDKDQKRSTKQLFSSGGKNSLFLLTIGPDGTPKKEIIYDYKDSKLRPRILTSKLINPSTIVLNADDQIGKLTF